MIAAVRDNGKGIVGVAPLAHVVPLRAFDDCGGGDLAWILQAFRYAADEAEAPIVSASFGSDPLAGAAQLEGVNEAFADVFAEFPSTLFVVAAGNEGVDFETENRRVYPCSTLTDTGEDPENVVCVGMSDKEDRPTCWSNVGVTSVDLFAPGLTIFSTVRPNKYMALDGTSVATPLVAGVAALVKATNESASAIEIKTALRAVDSIPGMDTTSAFGGRVNAARALEVPGRLGSGGPGLDVPWASCDVDHDGVRNVSDNCDDEPNAGQADADADAIGDACDSTPRGDDIDGDLKAALDDRCPTVPAPTADGCPAPPPPPPANTPTPTPAPPLPPTVDPLRIVDVDVDVVPRTCARRKSCKQSAKVTVRVNRTARVALKVERRVRRNGRLRWTRVTSRSLTTTSSGRSLTVRGKRGRTLVKGSYRVTVTLSGAPSARRNFRV